MISWYAYKRISGALLSVHYSYFRNRSDYKWSKMDFRLQISIWKRNSSITVICKKCKCRALQTVFLTERNLQHIIVIRPIFFLFFILLTVSLCQLNQQTDKFIWNRTCFLTLGLSFNNVWKIVRYFGFLWFRMKNDLVFDMKLSLKNMSIFGWKYLYCCWDFLVRFLWIVSTWMWTESVKHWNIHQIKMIMVLWN